MKKRKSGLVLSVRAPRTVKQHFFFCPFGNRTMNYFEKAAKLCPCATNKNKKHTLHQLVPFTQQQQAFFKKTAELISMHVE